MNVTNGLGLLQSCVNRGSVGRVPVFGLRWCGCCRWGAGSGECVGGLDQGLEGWNGVMSVSAVSPDSLFRWHVHVSVYCARLIPEHLRSTQYSILLHLIDI